MESLAKKKIAVVGAGLAGLTAAAELVKAEQHVTLIERSSAVGGRAATLVKDGFYLNQGPHALYKSGALYGYLRESNITLSHGPSPKFKRAFALAEGRLFDFPISIQTLVGTKVLSVGEKVELVSLITRLSAISTEEVAGVSLSHWLTNTTGNKRVREVIEALVRLSTYSNNPEEMSAGAAIRQLALALRGVVYLDHGWQTIVDAIYALSRHALETKLETEVRTVSPSAQGVEISMDGCSEHFDAVIMAIPPAKISALLPQSSSLDELNSISPNVVACLDVCLERLPLPDNTFALGIDEPLYYSVHSSAAELARGDQAVIHTAAYLEPGERGSEAHEKRLIEFLDAIQPGWTEYLVHKRFLPNMVASFGTARFSTNGSNGVANVTLSGDYPNVYVCGDWVGSSHLLADAAVDSARKAAAAILSQRDSSLSDLLGARAPLA